MSTAYPASASASCSTDKLSGTSSTINTTSLVLRSSGGWLIVAAASFSDACIASLSKNAGHRFELELARQLAHVGDERGAGRALGGELAEPLGDAAKAGRPAHPVGP